jgi:MFS family permease
VLAVGEFRALWASHALSAAGDRLALVALTVLVYSRTGSPFLAAVAYGAGTVPYLFGGVFLAGLADRLPRRAVMIACDLARALLAAVMALPGMPPGVLVALLYLVTAVQPAFDAARAAVTRDVLSGGLYETGSAVMQMTYRLVMLAGAAAAGLAVAVAGPRAAVAADAATFLASAALIRAGIHARPAAASRADAWSGNRRSEGKAEAKPWRGSALSGIRLVFGDPVLRTVMGLGWLAVFYEVPEGIAAPYAAAAGGSPAAAGLLIAAGQAMILAAPLWARLPEAARQRWMGPMAVAAAGTVTLTALHPGIAGSAAIFAAAGALGTYQVTVGTTFASSVPPACCAQALGIAAAGLVAGQGLAFAAAGWAAQAISPAAVTAAAGGLRAVTACSLAASWRRLRAVPAHPAPAGPAARTARSPRACRPRERPPRDHRPGLRSQREFHRTRSVRPGFPGPFLFCASPRLLSKRGRRPARRRCGPETVESHQGRFTRFSC